MRHFFHQAIFLSAYGSGSLTSGYLASEVSVAPKAVLTRTWALMAQPLALSTGPRLRRRSLVQAMNIDGPETIITIAARRMMMLYHLSVTNAPRPAKAAAMAPKAKPMAAKMPANLAMSNGAFLSAGAAAASGAAPSAGFVANLSVAVSALAVRLSICLASFSAAFLLILSVMNFHSFL